MNLAQWVVCKTIGHEWRMSRERPGYRTCLRCRHRELIRNPLENKTRPHADA
jgi:hypothetical protein